MLNSRYVTIVHDNNIYDRSYIELVKRYHDFRQVTVTSLNGENIKNSLLIIIQINLQDPAVLRQLKEKIPLIQDARVPVLFLLNQFSRREIVQANIMGATDYISYPCPDNNFIEIMADLVNRALEKAWENLSKTQENALKVSLKVVENIFNNAAAGKIISQKEVKDSCRLIIEATAKDGLTDWMNAIRQHHNYTYRHCMMVCGYLTSFGMILGVKDADLQLLSVGGMLHDIGKSMTPLSILDKPARLTPQEWNIMKKHAQNSGDILRDNGWSDMMIDIANHHHEKIDGSGYPHGLKGMEVSDLARMASIADMFSGLVDKRSYKPAMSAENAINILLDMKEQLDIPLVKAFQEVVLSGEEKIFAYQK